MSAASREDGGQEWPPYIKDSAVIDRRYSYLLVGREHDVPGGRRVDQLAARGAESGGSERITLSSQAGRSRFCLLRHQKMF
jgi:hypothetical protein